MNSAALIVNPERQTEAEKARWSSQVHLLSHSGDKCSKLGLLRAASSISVSAEDKLCIQSVPA